MKKSIIAAGAASVALAAMPIVGAFAANTDKSVTTLNDTINLTVESGCTMARTNGEGTYSGSLGSNATTEITGSTFTFTCTDATWTVSAEGAGENDGFKTALYKDATDQIATGTDLDGEHSAWGFKIAVSGTGIAAAGTYGSAYNQIPDSTTMIASGSAVTSNATVTPTYKVSTNATQAPGAYTGIVKYTVTDTNS